MGNRQSVTAPTLAMELKNNISDLWLEVSAALNELKHDTSGRGVAACVGTDAQHRLVDDCKEKLEALRAYAKQRTDIDELELGNGIVACKALKNWLANNDAPASERVASLKEQLPVWNAMYHLALKHAENRSWWKTPVDFLFRVVQTFPLLLVALGHFCESAGKSGAKALCFEAAGVFELLKIAGIFGQKQQSIAQGNPEKVKEYIQSASFKAPETSAQSLLAVPPTAAPKRAKKSTRNRRPLSLALDAS